MQVIELHIICVAYISISLCRPIRVTSHVAYYTFATLIVGSSKFVQTLGLLVPFTFLHVPPVCQRIVFRISVFVIQCLWGMPHPIWPISVFLMRCLLTFRLPSYLLWHRSYYYLLSLVGNLRPSLQGSAVYIR